MEGNRKNEANRVNDRAWRRRAERHSAAVRTRDGARPAEHLVGRGAECGGDAHVLDGPQHGQLGAVPEHARLRVLDAGARQADRLAAGGRGQHGLPPLRQHQGQRLLPRQDPAGRRQDRRREQLRPQEHDARQPHQHRRGRDPEVQKPQSAAQAHLQHVALPRPAHRAQEVRPHRLGQPLRVPQCRLRRQFQVHAQSLFNYCPSQLRCFADCHCSNQLRWKNHRQK